MLSSCAPTSICLCLKPVHDDVPGEELLIGSVVHENGKELLPSEESVGTNGAPPRANTKSMSLSELDERSKSKIDRLLEDHYIFEACAICPEYVEAKGHLKKFRDLAQVLCGGLQIQWDGGYEGKISGSCYSCQYRLGGATIYEDGDEFLWLKFTLDQEVGWGKLFGGFHEPEFYDQVTPEIKECYMVGDDHPTHAIRCEIAKRYGKTSQDYFEVRRYINKETGFCIESNASVFHDDLIKRGYALGKAKHEPNAETFVHILSFPRSETQCSAVFLVRWKPTHKIPKWAIRKGTLFLPTVARLVLPTVQATCKDPRLQALIDADKRGVHRYFKDWQQNALLTGVGKYHALNLPPPEVVIGQWTNPDDSIPSSEQGGRSDQVMSDTTRKRSKVSDVSVGTCWSRPMRKLLACLLCTAVCK